MLNDSNNSVVILSPIVYQFMMNVKYWINIKVRYIAPTFLLPFLVMLNRAGGRGQTIQ